MSSKGVKLPLPFLYLTINSHLKTHTHRAIQELFIDRVDKYVVVSKSLLNAG
ncbi:hypothetical protein VCHA50O413_180010 [Vibrio chagasii]|nr:hypothetical protein VCHA34P114_260006 [Vibrio chagasii]CAH6916385.1 hypothetical protein VCHA50O409_180002 [Vibrio chagasii]CAH6950426.1 hypothetical protein VCHA50O402_170010 [Vibrio chagasii]CAH6965404.1 hypothetical protein VCHA50O405_180012 [Vibrio chagasii]CAH7005773.1 hypothetical protein VCHA50O413_180010 [Vibrio chagasii]